MTTISKQYLRDLPNCLLTYERFDLFADLFAETNTISEEEKTKQARALIESIPSTNYQVLYHLIALVRKVCTMPYKENSKMSFESMAIVIGPNIMRTKKKLDLLQMEATSKVVNRTALFIIENYSKLFKQNSPYDDTLLGILASEEKQVTHDEKIDIQELRAETLRLRVAHRQQQNVLLNKILVAESERSEKEEEVILLKQQNERLQEDVKTLEDRIKAVENELERTLKGEGNEEEFKTSRDTRIMEDEFNQLDKLGKLLDEQDRQVKALQESMHRLGGQ